jgi:hypothetical protein
LSLQKNTTIRWSFKKETPNRFFHAMVWRCLPYLLLSGLAAAAHCEGRPLPVAAPNGTTTAESHGSHGHHALALESMLPISCALILAFVLSSSMESFQISFFPVGDGT